MDSLTLKIEERRAFDWVAEKYNLGRVTGFTSQRLLRFMGCDDAGILGRRFFRN
jgi:hypothetical protein